MAGNISFHICRSSAKEKIGLRTIMNDMNLILGNHQFWVLVIGSIVPLGGYLLNRVAPWVDETVKGIVQVILAALASALYAALDTNVFGWNNATFQLVVTGVVAALMAHNLLWRPAKVNVKLGATETHHAVGAVGTQRLQSDDVN